MMYDIWDLVKEESVIYIVYTQNHAFIYNMYAKYLNVYIVTGYTDLRYGINSLVALIEAKLGVRPFVPDTLYLFCGRRTDRIKGLVWESDGYLLLYKRLEQGHFLISLSF